MNVRDQVLLVLEQQKGNYISGAKLASELSVSRNAVWKAVKHLQEEGYAIETAPNRGYALRMDNDILSAPGIMKYLHPKYRKLSVEVYKSIDSTNTKIKEYAASGRPEGLVVIAQEQTAGRGRMGRSFYSPTSSGVYMSFLLRPKFTAGESTYLTTAAAVAAAETIDDVWKDYSESIKHKAGSGACQPDPDESQAVIKWVNDVYVRGKKVCGILTEASVNVENSMLEYAVTGIGFNVQVPENGFPEEIQDIAGAIFETDTAMDAKNRIAAEMINHFMKYYEDLPERTYMEEYRKRSFLLGREIYTVTDPPITGRAVDIDEEGHLIMELKDGSRKILSSGEVSVRPAAGDKKI